jgi:hypothetical protein
MPRPYDHKHVLYEDGCSVCDLVDMLHAMIDPKDEMPSWVEGDFDYPSVMQVISYIKDSQGYWRDRLKSEYSCSCGNYATHFCDGLPCCDK